MAECCAQPGQTGLFTQSCCDLVVPWPHTGVSFQVLLPVGRYHVIVYGEVYAVERNIR